MRSLLLRLACRQSHSIRPNACSLVPAVGSLSSSLYPCHLPVRFSTNVSTTATAIDVETDETLNESLQDETLPFRRFDQLQLHPKSLKALRRQGLHKLTEIQEKSFDVIRSGKDVVGRARTGTGKTLSFLLPSLERVVQQQTSSDAPPNGIAILVLSPTRELAVQIAKETERLVAQHGPEITSQVVYGGSSRFDDIDKLEKQLPTILVATPGRLKDHLATTKLNGKRPFIDTLQNLQVLILDETDRLLDMGFRKDIVDIVSCLPRKRQTLLFSATLPKEVRDVVQLAIKSDYEMVDCIQDEDPATQTNAQIQQSYMILPTHQFWTKTMEYLLDLIDKGDNKVMVFFPMTSMVQLYAQIFNDRFGRRVLELHGRMQQRERTTISRRFRNATHGTLFTSDVSARGVDYPNVTHVVQIGASGSRETYIHRLGRTGRAGKRGTGILILPTLERDFLHDLEGLEITPNSECNDSWTLSPPSKKFWSEMGPVVQDIKQGRDTGLEKSVQDAYQAMVSYYFQRSEDKSEAIATVNGLIETMGLWELPPIDIKRARRLGLDGFAELNIQSNWKDQSWSTGWTETETERSMGRPGKPYGDFDGSFGWEEPNRRGGTKYPSKREDTEKVRKGTSNSNSRSRRPMSSDRDDKHDRNVGNRSHRERNGWSEPRRDDATSTRKSWRQLADERRNKDKRNNRDGRSSDQHGPALVKVGWKRNDDFPEKPLFAQRKSKPTFQRWATPGEFAFKS